MSRVKTEHSVSATDEAHGGCAYFALMEGSRKARLLGLTRRLGVSLQNRGVAGTLRKIAEKSGIVRTAPLRPLGDHRPQAYRDEEVLGLQPGEWVEVKSADEIRRSLDHRKKSRGLLFMDEMWAFCGGRYRVLKRVNLIWADNTNEPRRVKNTVLLEGTTCNGSQHGGCDMGCQHLWREVWLRRVP